MYVDLATLKTQLRAVNDHWERLETELARSLTLEGGYTRAQLQADLAALETSTTGVVEGISEHERTAQTRDTAKAALLARFDQVKNKIKAQLPSSKHAAAVPRKPVPTYARERFLAPLDDLAEVWATINADTSLPTTLRPLTVGRGYTQANFVADLSALRAAYDAVEAATLETRQRRSSRSTPAPGLAKRVTQYRALVKSELDPGDALLATLP